MRNRLKGLLRIGFENCPMGLKLLSVAKNLCALPNIYHFCLTISNKVAVGVKTVTTVYGINQLQSYKIVSKKRLYEYIFRDKSFYKPVYNLEVYIYYDVS